MISLERIWGLTSLVRGVTGLAAVNTGHAYAELCQATLLAVAAVVVVASSHNLVYTVVVALLLKLVILIQWLWIDTEAHSTVVLCSNQQCRNPWRRFRHWSDHLVVDHLPQLGFHAIAQRDGQAA